MTELKDKLKKLRTERGLTQEAVAERLGISSQTVSKWERGLLSPDISLLPKIALLFDCSIDSLFDMDQVWGVEHRRKFEEKINALYSKKDWEGVYRAWIREIELNPDSYKNYIGVMLHVLRQKLYGKEYVNKMISLAEHAEKCCTNDDMRNEIYRVMLQICAESEDPKVKEKGRYYYNKLPGLRHSREVYAKFVMEGEKYRDQTLQNIIYMIDLAECSVRQLILPHMSLEEKLFYYQKAAALYEIVSDEKYLGFYAPALLSDYCAIAAIFIKLGQTDIAKNYIDRIFTEIEKHMDKNSRESKSKLLYSTFPSRDDVTEQNLQALLQSMAVMPEFETFRNDILKMQKRFSDYLQPKQRIKP